VEALLEFSRRQINLARIESRPQRRRLGRYLFFIDIEGRETDADVAGALDGLRTKAGSVRVLGSYPGATGPSSG
jgi:prephenate dehydratase